MNATRIQALTLSKKSMIIPCLDVYTPCTRTERKERFMTYEEAESAMDLLTPEGRRAGRIDQDVQETVKGKNNIWPST